MYSAQFGKTKLEKTKILDLSILYYRHLLSTYPWHRKMILESWNAPLNIDNILANV